MKKISCLLVIILSMNACLRKGGSNAEKSQADDTLIVQVKKRVYHDDGKRTYTDWIDFKTRTIRHLDGFNASKKPVELSKYGGRKDMTSESTGFFHVKKMDGRWWAVDPEGYLFFHIAVNSINTGRSERNKKALSEKFGSRENWINETNSILHSYGFNGAGSWSDTRTIISSDRQSVTPLAYTMNLNFMSGYGRERGGTYAVPGHTGFPNSTIFVFDEGFIKYCDKAAGQLVKYKDDPNLFGYFSDNELPFKLQTLDGYLTLEDQSDAGNIAARAWLKDRDISQEEISDEIRSEFLAYVADRYFRIVSEAIRKYDPNHMFLGPRLYSSEKNNEDFIRTAGKYVDLVSCNYYGRWTPVPEEINNQVYALADYFDKQP